MEYKVGQWFRLIFMFVLMCFMSVQGFTFLKRQSNILVVKDMAEFLKEDLADRYLVKGGGFKVITTDLERIVDSDGSVGYVLGETFCEVMTITVGVTEDTHDVMTTLAHEYVHAEQCVRGDELGPDSPEWKLPYMQRKHEIESRLKAPILVKRYLEYVERRKSK
jgi:hypothetical protein